jgi:hypothetical protein
MAEAGICGEGRIFRNSNNNINCDIRNYRYWGFSSLPVERHIMPHTVDLIAERNLRK